MSDAKITIYSTEFCGFCKLLKQYLDENNIEYKDVDVSSNEEVQKEMIEKSGQTGVPVSIIEKDGEEEVVVGFQKEKIDELLGL